MEQMDLAFVVDAVLRYIRCGSRFTLLTMEETGKVEKEKNCSTTGNDLVYNIVQLTLLVDGQPDLVSRNRLCETHIHRRSLTYRGARQLTYFNGWRCCS